MRLLLDGNSITELTLGVVGADQVVVPSQTIPCAPEDYIGIIDSFLTAHNLSLASLTGIQVASTDGSATALRVSHAIANAWGFARGIPLYRSAHAAPLPILLPEYAASAHVTLRKKDRLHRKT